MENNTYERGSLSISNHFLYLGGTSINLANIDNMEFVIFDRHSYFNGIKEWLGGFVILLIICSINRGLTWVGDLYIFTIFFLLAYNAYRHHFLYHGLKIETSSGKSVCLKSDNRDFLNQVHSTITRAIASNSASYTINLDSHDIINNGIISKGNKNKMKVVNKNGK